TCKGKPCAVYGGAAVCWGENVSGELRIGTGSASSVPVAVDTSGVLAGKLVTDISVGEHHTCVVADGAVYCWGRNDEGQLGTGSLPPASGPEAVDSPGELRGKPVTDLAAGNDHTCAA